MKRIDGEERERDERGRAKTEKKTLLTNDTFFSKNQKKHNLFKTLHKVLFQFQNQLFSLFFFTQNPAHLGKRDK